jgi:hypothetical protein
MKSDGLKKLAEQAPALPTPGPWRHEREVEKRFDSRTGEPTKGFVFDWIVGATGRAGCAFGDEGGEAIANARLIAAAPEMLSLLEDAQEVLCEYGGPAVELLERIDALIAKAKGGA